MTIAVCICIAVGLLLQVQYCHLYHTSHSTFNIAVIGMLSVGNWCQICESIPNLVKRYAYIISMVHIYCIDLRVHTTHIIYLLLYQNCEHQRVQSGADVL